MRMRMLRFRLLLEDILAQLPASSVQVERQHANVQLDASAHRMAPQRPSTIQANSYLMNCILEHSELFRNIDSEIVGKGTKRKRVQTTLRGRVVDSAAPANGLRRSTCFTDEGHVRGRNGLLKGLLPSSRTPSSKFIFSIAPLSGFMCSCLCPGLFSAALCTRRHRRTAG